MTILRNGKKHGLMGSFVVLLLVLVAPNCSQNVFRYETDLPDATERYWLAPELWTNRLQDWRLREGRIECIGPEQPRRTVHLLTRSLGETSGDLQMTVRTGLIEDQLLDRDSWNGFLIGVGGPDLDYRARSIIHLGSGPGGGLVAAVDGAGHLVFYDNEESGGFLEADHREGGTVRRAAGEDLRLELHLRPGSEGYDLTLTLRDAESGDLLQESSLYGIAADRMTGNVALVAHGGDQGEGGSFWFDDWTVEGSKVEIHEDRAFGPVLSTLYTVSDGTLNLTAQFPPLAESDADGATLWTRLAGESGWSERAEAEIVPPSWTAQFSVPSWDASQDAEFRVSYPLKGRDGEETHYFEGKIRPEPGEEEPVVVAGFTGNSNTRGSFGPEFSFTRDYLWFPHEDVVQHVASRAPDFLVFTGDQVYESRPTAPDRSGGLSSELDYLYKWYLWCWAYQDLTRNAPAVCLPDDHDVYHGNIWGAGGRPAREVPSDGEYPEHYQGLQGHWRQDGGGYLMSPEFVNMVQATQTSHLPEPFDPRPVEQGIGVYYTSIEYGGVSFAVIEDRKFKSAPSVILEDLKVVNGFPQVSEFDPEDADVEEAVLLGDRQLDFLRSWASDWGDSWVKVALSQTIFATISTYPEGYRTDAGIGSEEALPEGVIPEGYELSHDMDTNGWPQSGRDRALAELRKGFAFMLAGDQHLGSIVHHGIDEWDDAGFSFCVPSVANLWPRRWYPPNPGGDHQEGMPDYTGKYLDGFNNRVHVWAVSNPVISNQEPAALHDRAPGYGLLRIDKQEQTITMECWPRYAQPDDPDSVQYPGWPKTISVESNYGREPAAFLPPLKFEGFESPVVQVLSSDGTVIYTRRVKGSEFQPKVFEAGETYSVRVGGEDVGWKTLDNLETVAARGEGPSIEIVF